MPKGPPEQRRAVKGRLPKAILNTYGEVFLQKLCSQAMKSIIGEYQISNYDQKWTESQ